MRASVRAALAALGPRPARPVRRRRSGVAPRRSSWRPIRAPSPAGDEVGLRASCTDNLKAATVTADAVRHGHRQARASASSPRPPGCRPTTKAGDYPVTLNCPDGQKATSTLHVVAKVEPTQGPATGGGGTAPGRSAPMMIGGGARRDRRRPGAGGGRPAAPAPRLRPRRGRAAHRPEPAGCRSTACPSRWSAGARPRSSPAAGSACPRRRTHRPAGRLRRRRLPARRPVRGRRPDPFGLIAAALVFVGLFVRRHRAGQRHRLRPARAVPRPGQAAAAASSRCWTRAARCGIEIPAIKVRGADPRGRAGRGRLDRRAPAAAAQRGRLVRRAGPTPGQFGPALIVGHADTRTGPSVFHGLAELKPGAEDRGDPPGPQVAVFEVNSVEHFGKEQAARSTGSTATTAGPSLRLITCGGTLAGRRARLRRQHHRLRLAGRDASEA